VWGAAFLAILVITPVLAVAASALAPRWEIWQHLIETRLLSLTWNTLRLLGGVALGAGALGVGLAWVVAVHRFPGRGLFEWALVLPMAVPAYVIGFVFVALFDFTGPVQSWMRGTFGPGAVLPDVRSYWGIVTVMSLVFYPYVYLLARSAFAERGVIMVEAARSMGQSSRAAFWRLALPLARPAIAAGLALALMETLADFGTVSIFGYDTFTTAVYRVWFGMFDRTAAGQIALVLMGFALALVAIERTARGRARHVAPGGVPPRFLETPRGRAWLLTAACTAVLVVAFLLPAGLLVAWSVRAIRAGSVAGGYLILVRNTVGLAIGAALLAGAVALLLAYGGRLARTRPMRVLSAVALSGYAAPGSVIAVGVLLVLTQVENALTAGIRAIFGVEPPLIVLASVAGLLFAYLVRFLSVAFHPVQTGLERIPVSLDESARALGATAAGVLRDLHAPLLRDSLLTGMMLVMMEVLKEMPATMLIRPFGVDTLAVEIWQRTTDAMWVEAAPPSLAILLAGALLACTLTRLRTSPRGERT
jgi:iron(III) transport system permease protein